MVYKVLSSDDVSDLSAWELPDFGNGGRKNLRLPTVEEIEKIQTDAYKEAHAQGFKRGQEEGHTKGYKESLAKGNAEIQAKLDRLTALLASLAQPLASMDDEVEQQLVHLAFVLAEQIVRREIRTQPGEIVAVVREALAMLPGSARQVRVHVHPEDASLLRETLVGSEQDAGWKIVEDALISRGGCHITTANSRIDASLEKRLTALANQVLGDEREGVEADQ